MSSRDNWELLVGAVLDREKLIRLALSHSRSSSSVSSQSPSSSFSSGRLQSGNQSFELKPFPDENKYSSFLVAPKKLGIVWGKDSRYWNWISHVNSRFPEVGVLNHVWWLDIRGKIKTRLLSPETTYAAFLVFQLTRHASCLEVANAMIRFVNDQTDKQAERRATVVHLQPTRYPINGRAAVPRRDGWMEVQLGNFSFEDGYGGDVEARLLETTDATVKTGLIVEGIEFRQVHVSGSEAILSPKKYLTKEEEEEEEEGLGSF